MIDPYFHTWQSRFQPKIILRWQMCYVPAPKPAALTKFGPLAEFHIFHLTTLLENGRISPCV